MHQGCLFFGAESDGIIYYGLSAEMTKIQAVFTFCGWLETISEGGKSPVTPLILQIGQEMHHRVTLIYFKHFLG